MGPELGVQGLGSRAEEAAVTFAQLILVMRRLHAVEVRLLRRDDVSAGGTRRVAVQQLRIGRQEAVPPAQCFAK